MSGSVAESLLDERSAVPYLVAAGLLDGSPCVATVLGGGVSNVVLAVRQGRRSLVVKQSLGRLRVRDEWHAPRERVLAEAAALEEARRLTPTSVPQVLHRDPDRHVIVIEAAPESWRDWKSQLLRGEITDAVAVHLGEVLGRWHRVTSGGQGLPPRLLDAASFEVLRLDPYYRTVARRAPELSGRLEDLIDQLTGRRLCLVHGDFSPKNVLVDPGGDGRPVWVIDFEVAHLGDPAFDVAFMASHLTLKALHRPVWARHYDACLRGFAKAYAAEVHRGSREARSPLTSTWSYVLSHVGALLAARVRGKSPAEYLTPDQQSQAWRLASALLQGAPERLEDLFAARGEIGS